MADYIGNYEGPRLDLGAALEEHSFDFNGIGLQILTPLEVPRASASFTAFKRESILQRGDDRAAADGHFNRITTEEKDMSFECVERGLEGQVFDRDRAFFANDFDADYEVSSTVRRSLLQEQEIRIQGLCHDESTFTTAGTFTDSSSDDPWLNPDADIIGQLIDLQELVREANAGVAPKWLAIGKKQLVKMLKNKGIKAQFPGNPLITRALLEEALPQIFGYDRMLVAEEMFNTADKGQAFSAADIWGSSHVFAFSPVPAGASIKTAGLGRTYAWRDNGGLLIAEQYRENRTRSTVIRLRMDCDERVQDAKFAGLLKTD